jgi:hypothetical protein
MDVTRRSMLKFSGAGVVAAGVVAVAPTGLAEAAAPGGSLRAAPAASAEAQVAVTRARQLVARMTLDEKIAYCHGIPATKGFTAAGLSVTQWALVTTQGSGKVRLRTGPRCHE